MVEGADTLHLPRKSSTGSRVLMCVIVNCTIVVNDERCCHVLIVEIKHLPHLNMDKLFEANDHM